MFPVWIYLIRTKRCGEIEQNPGPKSNSSKSFSICQWNLSSISSHSVIKLSLLRAHIAVLAFVVVCLSETFVNASISNDDNNLEVNGYNCLKQIIYQTLNEEVFVFVTEIIFPLKLSGFGIY